MANSTTQHSSTSTASTILSHYLLRGWRMLAAACENGCNSPMMSKDGITICVICDSRRAPDVPASPALAPSVGSDTSLDRNGDRRTSMTEDELNTLGLDADGIADENTRTPRIRELYRGLEQEEESDEEPGERIAREMDEAMQSNSTEPRREATHERSSRMSSLLGARMLQGWIMLNETCPHADCIGVPLMKNRDPIRPFALCVHCNNEFALTPTNGIAGPNTPSASSATPIAMGPSTSAPLNGVTTPQANGPVRRIERTPAATTTTAPPPSRPTVPSARVASPARAPSTQRSAPPQSRPTSLATRGESVQLQALSSLGEVDESTTSQMLRTTMLAKLQHLAAVLADETKPTIIRDIARSIAALWKAMEAIE